MELTALLGLLLGIGGILLGNSIEGGHLASLAQLAAAVIVLCGTFGAVLVSSRKKDIRLAYSLFKVAMRGPSIKKSEQTFGELLEYGLIARKESLLAIEPKLTEATDPFMQSALRAVIDGLDVKIIREIFEKEIDIVEENLLAGAKVWMDAGGFAPTIGIIGAVLGLIHVMSNLADTSRLGAGIAVAFVATIYGVGFANLIFIPIANKIKKRISDQIRIHEMILEGALAIQAGLSPAMIEIRLKPFLEKEN